MFSGSTRQLLHLLSINRVSYKLRSMIWKRLNIKTPQHWNHLTLKPLNIETTQKLLNEEFSLYVGNASNLGIFLIRFSKNLFHRFLHCWLIFLHIFGGHRKLQPCNNKNPIMKSHVQRKTWVSSFLVSLGNFFSVFVISRQVLTVRTNSATFFLHFSEKMFDIKGHPIV